MNNKLERIHPVTENLYVEESENDHWIFLYTDHGRQEFALLVEQLPALVAVLEAIAVRRFPPLGTGSSEESAGGRRPADEGADG